MRLIRPFLAVACLGLGVAVGALNRDPVAIDLGPVVVRATLGVALLGAVLAGALAGGIAMALGRARPRQEAPQASDDATPEI